MKRAKRTPLERAINRREGAIKGLENRKREVMANAARECARLDKIIAVRRVLLDAMKAGTITP